MIGSVHKGTFPIAFPYPGIRGRASTASVATLAKNGVGQPGFPCRAASKSGEYPYRKNRALRLTAETPCFVFWDKREVANLLHEDAETRSIRERLRQKQQAQQKQNKKKSRDSWER